MEHSQSLPELSALVAELAGEYHAGRLSAEEAAEFEAIRERVASLEEKARARLAELPARATTVAKLPPERKGKGV
jgi:anti-sigma-K factor RskA